MLEKMLNVRTIILHDVNIKGFCTKNLNQLQVFYWGKSQIARDVRIPFQLCKMRKLEMVILRATEIDLGIKVFRADCYDSMPDHLTSDAPSNAYKSPACA